MKNRILNLFGFSLVIMCFVLMFSDKTFAYGYDTHALLSKEAIDLYDKQSSIDISDRLKGYIIDGSRREDDAPRWINHFYDPVMKRALMPDPSIDPLFSLVVDKVARNAQTAKVWAQSEASQSSFPYNISSLIDIHPVNIGTILSGTEQRKIAPLDGEADFAWQRALRFYINGDEEKAMFALGHVIHLLQDMSVPDHTRNDAHIMDSPYEAYASRYDLGNIDPGLEKRLETSSLVPFSDLNVFFDDLALYSNNNFYSKDTIGIQSGYDNPKPDYEIKEGKYIYAIKDIGGEKYKLSFKEGIGVFNNVISYDVKISGNDDGEAILSDYWSRLSTKSVEYSAGVIDLFFKEAERYKKDPWSIPGDRPFLAEVGEAVGDFFIDAGNAIKNAVLGMMGEEKMEPITEISSDSSVVGSELEDVSVPDKEDKKILPKVSVSKKEVKQGQVIHETGSKFTPKSSVTLFFISPPGVISQFTLISDNDGKFDNRYVMPDDALLGKYSYYAKDESTGLVSEKVKFAVIEGNKPKAATKNIVIPPVPDDDEELEEDEVVPESDKKKEEKLVSVCSFSEDDRSPVSSVRINELAWMGGSSSTADEWIELKNIGLTSVDVSGWEIVDKGGDIRIKFQKGTKIDGNGLLLLERTNDDSAPEHKADLIYSGTLSNTNEGLRLFDPDCGLVDKAETSSSWPAGDQALKKTMERLGSIWQTSSLPGGTPGADNSTGSVSVVVSQPSSVSQTFSGSGGGLSAPVICSIEGGSPSGRVLINEVAWSGDAHSSSHEWVELRNTSSTEISLSGWQFFDEARDIKIFFGSGDKISAGGFYVMERGSVDFISGVEAKRFFTGTINNSDESLYLTDGSCHLIDSVVSSGANWKNIGGSSSPEYRSAERSSFGVWHTYFGAGEGGIMGTPGRGNSIVVEGSSDGAQASSLLISEVMPGSVGDPDNEFIELYNPTDTAVSMTGWTIGRRTSPGAEENMLMAGSDDQLSGVLISAKGFLLIGSREYTGLLSPDARYSFSSPHLAYDGDIVSLYDGLGNLIDEVSYGEISMGKSWERRLYSEGVCSSPSGIGEFMGNGCFSSSDGAISLRDIPKAQNTRSLPEPRNAPSLPSGDDGWDVFYNPEDVSLDISFEELPVGASVVVSDTTSGEIVFSGDNPGSWRIFHVGRSYDVGLKLEDSDGMASDMMTKTVNAPSFADISFFSGTKKEFDGNYFTGPILRLDFPEYPFLPSDAVLESPHNEPPYFNYKAAVFYLDADPPANLNLEYELPPAETIGVTDIRYKSLMSGYESRSSLMLPDSDGIFIDGANNDKQLSYVDYLMDGDGNIVLPVDIPDGVILSPERCLSVAYYGFSRVTVGSEEENKRQFKLIAVDDGKYCFNSAGPIDVAPDSPGSPVFSYDEGRGSLLISWDHSTDVDSPDGLISYEISYDEGVSWEPSGANTEKNVAPNDVVLVAVRSFDDFGTRSSTVSGEYTVPSSGEDISRNTPETVSGSSFGQSFSGRSMAISGIVLDMEVSSVGTEYLNIYDLSTLTQVLSLSRTFEDSEIGVREEYEFRSVEPFIPDGDKTYIFASNFPSLAPVIIWGSADDILPDGNPIRDILGLNKEGVGPIKDLYYRFK
ncbi:MAG: lamin tail domain-containing protein [Candidatus Colwellbacteria bacterium]|nr:lamin tail domain-containing protein [Candidatus Colwellbacteria bacterium]